MDYNNQDLRNQIFPKYTRTGGATPGASSTAPEAKPAENRHLLRKLLITLVVVVILGIVFLAALPSFV